MRFSKIKLDLTEKLSVTLYFQICGAIGVIWLLLQSNHDVSTFSFRLTLGTKFRKKKRNTSEKIQRSWKEKDPISWRVLATKEEYKASKKFLKNVLLHFAKESRQSDQFISFIVSVCLLNVFQLKKHFIVLLHTKIHKKMAE